MKAIAKLFVIALTLLFLPAVFAASSAIGYWKTIDDTTGKPKAIIQIWQSSDQTLTGRILKIWPRPGYDQNEVCEACKGANHNQRIVGMIILQGLRQSKADPLLWVNGTILDPKNGKVYHSQLQVMGNGNSLKVRGYIGIPLFGRSQTWIRVSGPTSN